MKNSSSDEGVGGGWGEAGEVMRLVEMSRPGGFSTPSPHPPTPPSCVSPLLVGVVAAGPWVWFVEGVWGVDVDVDGG